MMRTRVQWNCLVALRGPLQIMREEPSGALKLDDLLQPVFE
jgi:hypothetical protein